jgi:hypothetical protein
VASIRRPRWNVRSRRHSRPCWRCSKFRVRTQIEYSRLGHNQSPPALICLTSCASSKKRALSSWRSNGDPHHRRHPPTCSSQKDSEHGTHDFSIDSELPPEHFSESGSGRQHAGCDQRCFGQMARARWEVAAEYLQKLVAEGALWPCSPPSRKQCRDVLCRFSENSGRELWIGYHSGQSQGPDQRRKRNQRSPLGGVW